MRYSVFAPLDTFERRHIGPEESDIKAMCARVKVADLDDLVEKTIPKAIHLARPTRLGPALSETQVLARIKEIAAQNKVFKSYIGLGYNASVTPAIILRNVMENPGWYTQYTPYQPEIAQGRLESLINFQTLITDMTGMDVSNASLLDEGTAAAEGMLLCYSAANRKKNVFFVDEKCFPQTIACVQTRAVGFGIKVVVGDFKTFNFESHSGNVVGALVQYPAADGQVVDYEEFVKSAHANGALVACATDLLSLALLKPPGEFGVDIALGNSQRFGVPLGYGGPHAAFFAVKDALKRRIPGRLIGLSKDATGKPAYRLALQTREQHIRREKATSNICTAQALLANMAAMYAVYHGPEGIKEIAQRIHNFTRILAAAVTGMGHKVVNRSYFDTLTVKLTYKSKDLHSSAIASGINICHVDASHVSLTINETTNREDLQQLIDLFHNSSFEKKFQSVDQLDSNAKIPSAVHVAKTIGLSLDSPAAEFPSNLKRSTNFLTHPVFNSYHSETEMLRYINYLQKKDLSLADAMIPLGSCTMKLNATTEMIPVTYPEFGNIHPFVPLNQAEGYSVLLRVHTSNAGIRICPFRSYRV